MDEIGRSPSAKRSNLEMLQKGTYDSRPEVVRHALEGLKKIEAYDWRTYDRACEIVAEEKIDGEVRMAAATLIEQINQVMRTHAEMLENNPSKNVKIGAINVLAKGGHHESRELIANYLNSNVQAVSEAAKCALKRLEEIDKQRDRTDAAVSKMTSGLGKGETRKMKTA